MNDDNTVSRRISPTRLFGANTASTSTTAEEKYKSFQSSPSKPEWGTISTSKKQYNLHQKFRHNYDHNHHHQQQQKRQHQRQQGGSPRYSPPVTPDGSVKIGNGHGSATKHHSPSSPSSILTSSCSSSTSTSSSPTASRSYSSSSSCAGGTTTTTTTTTSTNTSMICGVSSFCSAAQLAAMTAIVASLSTLITVLLTAQYLSQHYQIVSEYSSLHASDIPTLSSTSSSSSLLHRRNRHSQKGKDLPSIRSSTIDNNVDVDDNNGISSGIHNDGGVLQRYDDFDIPQGVQFSSSYFRPDDVYFETAATNGKNRSSRSTLSRTTGDDDDDDNFCGIDRNAITAGTTPFGRTFQTLRRLGMDNRILLPTELKACHSSNESKDDHVWPKIAWLMSFPNSGTSFTIHMIRQSTNATTATNYALEGEIKDRPGIPIHPSFANHGPWLEIIPNRTTSVPKSYIMTKTHCGGFCNHCSLIRHLETLRSFQVACRTGNIAMTPRADDDNDNKNNNDANIVDGGGKSHGAKYNVNKNDTYVLTLPVQEKREGEENKTLRTVHVNVNSTNATIPPDAARYASSLSTDSINNNNNITNHSSTGSILLKSVKSTTTTTATKGKLPKKRVTYPKEYVHRAVHLIRHPFDNIVARFHLDYNRQVHVQKNESYGTLFPNNQTGFRRWCSHYDKKFIKEIKTTHPRWIDKELEVSMYGMPCKSEFLRYVQWHNLAFGTTMNELGIPTLVIYYEDYHHQFNQTKESIIAFLELESASEQQHHDDDEEEEKKVFFQSGKEYGNFYTNKQKTIIWNFIRNFASWETWQWLERYYTQY